MATRDYWMMFGSSAVSGLNPTFITFINGAGSNITPPSITEPGTRGLYKFSYDATQTICFLADGATIGLAAIDRYVPGVLDPQDTFGVTLNAVSATLTAIGTDVAAIGSVVSGIDADVNVLGQTLAAVATDVDAIGVQTTDIGLTLSGIAGLLGDSASSFGSTSADPTTLFGFLKRNQEFWEGDNVYTKATGILQFLSRGTGSSTLLREKTVSDSTTITTKS